MKYNRKLLFVTLHGRYDVSWNGSVRGALIECRVSRPSSWLQGHGIFHFLGLPCLSSFLPSVNVRPCIINVNPPEMRGAALADGRRQFVNYRTLERDGIGPSCSSKYPEDGILAASQSANVVHCHIHIGGVLDHHRR